MDKRIFQTNLELAENLLTTYDSVEIIITPGRRLAHFLQDVHRRTMIKMGKDAWRPLAILSLSSFFQSLNLHLSGIPLVAPRYLRWKLFSDIIKDYSPPPPFRPGLDLAKSLDRALSTLLRHRIHWDPKPFSDPFQRWRNKIFSLFTRGLKDQDLIHPEELPEYIIHAPELSFFLPSRVHAVLLDTLAPTENIFLSRLAQKVELVYWDVSPSPQTSDARWIGFSDPIQEAQWVVTEVLNATEKHSLHNLGIVTMDPGGQIPLYRDYLKEILGKGAAANQGAYNITLGKRLVETGLLKALLLPLRFWIDGEERKPFTSLLLSGYYGITAGKRDELSLIDRQLREKNLHRDIGNLLGNSNLSRDLYSLLKNTKWIETFTAFRNLTGSISEWSSKMHQLWEEMSFPVLSDEQDQIAWRHVKEMMGNLTEDLGETPLTLAEFLKWLTSASAEITLAPVGHENAGIQIMGPLEARGLWFDRLWITGLTGGTLPQPPRHIQLLTFDELKHIRGCSPESQWDFAKNLFAKLMATSPQITVSRHLEKEGEPTTVSPFWVGEEIKKEVHILEDRTGWWVRSSTYLQARKGLLQPSSWVFPDKSLFRSLPFEEISVSQLETWLLCPFRFMINYIFKIEPLQEEILGLAPQEKGILLHSVLEHLVESAIKESLAPGSSELRDILRSIAEKKLTTDKSNPFHSIELKRWLDGENALLFCWLDRETEHFNSGYRWLDTEKPFRGLNLPSLGLKLRGRIDRIDASPEGSLVCWEYKTGRTPSPKEIFHYMTRPQLPVYTLAISNKGLAKSKNQKNKIPTLVSELQNLNSDIRTAISESSPGQISAGFISLKKAGEIEIKECRPPKESWESFLSRWLEKVSHRIRAGKQGSFAADPLPPPEDSPSMTPCRFCAFGLLCNRNFQGESSMAGADAP